MAMAEAHHHHGVRAASSSDTSLRAIRANGIRVPAVFGREAVSCMSGLEKVHAVPCTASNEGVPMEDRRIPGLIVTLVGGAAVLLGVLLNLSEAAGAVIAVVGAVLAVLGAVLVLRASGEASPNSDSD